LTDGSLDLAEMRVVVDVGVFPNGATTTASAYLDYELR